MNRKGFRLPQAAPWLLAGVFSAWAVGAAGTARAEESVAPPTDQPAPAEAAEAGVKDVDEQGQEQREERSVVYSLRDYQRAETTATSPEEYLGQQDGIARSLEGPDVVITAGTERTVYEYRQGGQLRLVKIIPRLGRPYYLVPADPTRGFGDLGQANQLLPQWKIIEF